jgi:hypothetical protein
LAQSVDIGVSAFRPLLRVNRTQLGLAATFVFPARRSRNAVFTTGLTSGGSYLHKNSFQHDGALEPMATRAADRGRGDGISFA